MSGTAGIINATIMHIDIGGVKINNQMSAELSLSMEPRESLNKDSEGWRNRYAGAKSWELSGEAEYAPDAVSGFQEMSDAFEAGLPVIVRFSTAITGDRQYQASALITSLSKSAGVEENVSFSYTLSGSGALVSTEIKAGGAVNFLQQPANGDTLTFDPEVLADVFTFVTDPPEADSDVQIGATLQDTIDNFIIAFNTEVSGYTASLSPYKGSIISITSDSEGEASIVEITTDSESLSITQMQ